MSGCPVCGLGRDKPGMHVDCVVKIRDYVEKGVHLCPNCGAIIRDNDGHFCSEWVCPVCTKGEYEDVPEPTKRMWLQRLPISHLACVTAMTEELDEATAWLSCDEPWVQVQEAKREAAFWKWLWEHTNPILTGDSESSMNQWLAHMRERFEREGA